MKISKRYFYIPFTFCVVLLLLIKCTSSWWHPLLFGGDEETLGQGGCSVPVQASAASVPTVNNTLQSASSENTTVPKEDASSADTSAGDASFDDASVAEPSSQPTTSACQDGLHSFFAKDGSRIKNKIFSVVSYDKSFPDLQEVQIQAATRYGVPPIQNREEAESKKKQLVYIGSNPYYKIDDAMCRSIPYLVPRAQVLLQDISRAFLDSLAIKGIPLHKLIVSSVLRTEEDVAKLRRHNGNASEQSCHRFGTTVDICYNRFQTVSDPNGDPRRAVRSDSLKWVLSEVLRDFREAGRCYVKYEVKQGCFHLTTR